MSLKFSESAPKFYQPELNDELNHYQNYYYTKSDLDRDLNNMRTFSTNTALNPISNYETIRDESLQPFDIPNDTAKFIEFASFAEPCSSIQYTSTDVNTSSLFKCEQLSQGDSRDLKPHNLYLKKQFGQARNSMFNRPSGKSSQTLPQSNFKPQSTTPLINDIFKQADPQAPKHSRKSRRRSREHSKGE